VYSLYTQAEYIKHIESLLERLNSVHGYTVYIGAEIEFYLHCEQEVIDKVLKDVLDYCDRVEKEKGWKQFELVFEKTNKIESIATDIAAAKNFLVFEARRLEGRALFHSKPFPDDYGSAMHFLLSLHDEYGDNVFAEGSVDDNKILQKCISGILSIAAESLYLLCKDDADYNRLVPKFMAPTHVSWGGNNRSTVVRIPDSAPESRRIEYRLASSSNDPAAAIFLMMLGLLYGLENELPIYPRIYGNAYDEQYSLQALPKSMSEAKNLFEKDGKIANYIGKILHRAGN